MGGALTSVENHTQKVNQFNTSNPARVDRDRSKEKYFCHAGCSGGTSVRTILQSKEQIKLIVLGSAWYMFQAYTFMVLANYLVYVTFHNVDPENPAYPGKVAVAGTDPFHHNALYDVGFRNTPDLSYRPWYLKGAFVDLNVFIAQMLPPLILVITGQTKRFVTYVGAIGFNNILKGVIQVVTVLPPANGGEGCWTKNFKALEIGIVDHHWTWIFTRPWGMTHGCNDMLWSGHTSQSCIGFLFIASALKREGFAPACINGVLFCYFLGYIWSVLACRMHYTVDVLIAGVIGLFIYTHAGFRQTVWHTANFLVCNSPESSPDAKFSPIAQSS